MPWPYHHIVNGGKLRQARLAGVHLQWREPGRPFIFEAIAALARGLT